MTKKYKATQMNLWDQKVAPVLASRGLSVSELAPFASACIRRVWDKNKDTVATRAAPACVVTIEEAILSVQRFASDSTKDQHLDGLAADIDAFVPGEDSIEETIASYNYTVLSVRYLVEAIAREDPLLVFEAARAAYEAMTGDAVCDHLNKIGRPITESESISIERGMQQCENEIAFQLAKIDSLSL